MSQYLLFAIASVALFCVSLYSLIISAHLVRKILAVNVMASAVFLFFLSVAQRNDLATPDPVPQAMVLTGLVVSVSISAFALALVRRIHALTGLARLPEQGDDS